MQDPKNRQKFAICAPSRAISSQLRHVSTIGKKLLKRPYRPNMSSQYGELRPTNGWDRFGNLGHPSKFQLVSHLGSVTARHSSSGRQPNFAALNTRRHLYSAWRPWCYAFAHILVLELISCKCTSYTNFKCCQFTCSETNLQCLDVTFEPSFIRLFSTDSTNVAKERQS